jgi:[CysO sulfur-carrier protein]-S-L-cysteine hydrolase
MKEPDLILPRRLAIQLLHEAQIAAPEPIHGWVLAADGAPSAWLAGPARPARAVWARLWSVPLASAIPTAAEMDAETLHLLVSLNTKGVLEMRAWELRNSQPHERILKIHD